MKPALRALATTLLAVGATACSSMPVPPPEDCIAISERCAPYDNGAGAPHDCRAFADNTSTTDRQCEQRLQECLNACPLPDAASDVRTDATADSGD